MEKIKQTLMIKWRGYVKTKKSTEQGLFSEIKWEMYLC